MNNWSRTYRGWWVELEGLVKDMKAARLEKVLVQVVTVPHRCYDNHLGTHTPHLLQKIEKHCKQNV